MNKIAALTLGALTLSTSAEAATGSLPLRHGQYVDVSTSCGGAPSSAKSWFGGGYVIQAAHAQCKLKSVRQRNRRDYVVTVRCNANSDPAMPFTKVDRVRIFGPTEYEMTNEFGRFRSRWCAG